MFTLSDVLAHNCPNDIKDIEGKGQYALHRIDLHCTWYAAITLSGEVIEESFYQFNSDKGYDHIIKTWKAIGNA